MFIIFSNPLFNPYWIISLNDSSILENITYIPLLQDWHQVSFQLWSIPIIITKVCSQQEHSCDICSLPVSPSNNRGKGRYKLTVFCIDNDIFNTAFISWGATQIKHFLLHSIRKNNISTFILYLSVYFSIFLFSGIYVLYHHYIGILYIDKKNQRKKEK